MASGGTSGMHIKVEPAKREGRATTILDQPLETLDILRDDDGTIYLCLCAGGIYDAKSRYRYEIILSEADLAILANPLILADAAAD